MFFKRNNNKRDRHNILARHASRQRQGDNPENIERSLLARCTRFLFIDIHPLRWPSGKQSMSEYKNGSCDVLLFTPAGRWPGWSAIPAL